jgi:hypothetical protein
MIQSILRYASIAISAIVLLSFAMFVTDQSESGSAKEVARVTQEGYGAATAQQPAAAEQPAPATPRAAQKEHGQPRRAIDGADKKILAPFDGVVRSSSSEWVRKGVSSLLALAVFGFGLSFLANAAAARRL